MNPLLNRREGLLAWQHLALSGFIPGNYDGGITAGIPMNESQAGVNSPASKYPAGLWAMSTTTESNINGNPSYDDLKVSGNFIFVGSHIQIIICQICLSLLIPQDAKNIDDKIDDWQPLTGSVWQKWLSKQ